MNTSDLFLLQLLSDCRRMFISPHRVDQHLESGCCQTNGNALSQSSNPRAPNPATDHKLIIEITIDYFLEAVKSIDIVAPQEVHYHMNEPHDPQLSNHLKLQRSEAMQRSFGWAKRRTLRHPPLLPRMIDFLKYLFHRGNLKEISKCSPYVTRDLAIKFGTSHKVFDSDEYWSAATAESGGNLVFTAEDIPEEWRVKQLIS